jgi:hypothetical protein
MTDSPKQKPVPDVDKMIAGYRRWIRCSVVVKTTIFLVGTYLSAPAAVAGFLDNSLLRLWVLTASFPLHVAGFFLAFLHLVPKGWTPGEPDDGESPLQFNNQEDDPETREQYLERQNLQTKWSLIMLEMPCVLCLGAMLAAEARWPFQLVILVGLLLVISVASKFRKIKNLAHRFPDIS